MSDVRRTRGQQGPHDETRAEMARQAARDLHRISSDDREQQLGENGEEQGGRKESTIWEFDKPKKNSAKGVVIAIIVIALLQIVPAIFAFVADELVPEIESSFGNAPAPEYDSDYSYAAQDLSSILGTDSGMVIDNSDTFRLHYDQSNDEWAILYTSADGGTFKSTADAWCLYDDPDEYYYPEAYPSDQYDMYTVAFTLYDTEAVGSLPDWCQSIADSGDDIWLNLYVSKTDDTLLIEDMDGIGLFGTTDPVPYYREQNM